MVHCCKHYATTNHTQWLQSEDVSLAYWTDQISRRRTDVQINQWVVLNEQSQQRQQQRGEGVVTAKRVMNKQHSSNQLQPAFCRNSWLNNGLSNLVEGLITWSTMCPRSRSTLTRQTTVVSTSNLVRQHIRHGYAAKFQWKVTFSDHRNIRIL